MFAEDPDLPDEYGLGLIMTHDETTSGDYMEWISKIFYANKNGQIVSMRKPDNIWNRSTMYAGGVKQFIANPMEHSIAVAKSLEL
jgi:hypothetical protein